MYKVSVIVPIYNVEKYLSKCIESILNQSYHSIELILVNDGSPDSSEKICKDYLYDARVKYIVKKNGGVSSARNVGIEASTGQYLMFVDADDFIEKNMIEEMIKEMDENQTCFCGYNELFVNNCLSIKSQEKKEVDNKEVINTIFKYKFVSGFLWNKIYDAKIIKKHKIRFNEMISYCEDLLFNVEYLSMIKKAIIIPKSLYNYRMRKSGVTWERNHKKMRTILDSYEKIESILKQNQIESIEFLYNKLNTYYRLGYKAEKERYLKEFKLIMRSKEISFKRKIKLCIIKNFMILHKLYMKNKINKNKLYE